MLSTLRAIIFVPKLGTGCAVPIEGTMLERRMQSDMERTIPTTEADLRDAKHLSPAAQRALQEAQARRAQQTSASADPAAKEVGGQSGPDPVRYGDWEQRGIASDF